jgi:hypothetical protein
MGGMAAGGHLAEDQPRCSPRFAHSPALMRPDLHIAWERHPAGDAAAIIDRVRGAHCSAGPLTEAEAR